ncbi:MAG: transposase [Sphaerospermopsis kisseleviana]
MAAALWAWVSAQHYAAVVEQNREHLLVFVKEQVDFSAVEKACWGYQVYAGAAGQPATYSLGTLCGALVVKSLYNWSYRQTEGEIRSQSLLRWFVGLGLQEPTPDHLTLWRFAQWVKQQQRRLFFDETLKQIDAAFAEERQATQMGDTFALASRAHDQSRTTMLRGACRRLLGYLAPLTPRGHAQVLTRLDPETLFGAKDERPEQFLDKPERDALEIRTATAAHRCLQLVVAQRQALGNRLAANDVVAQALVRWEGIVGKLLRDEFVITTDPTGVATRVSHPTKRQKGCYRHGSIVDLDATFRIHGEKIQLGYNANLAVTVNFIREINAVTGATPDSAGVADLIANQKQHLGSVPPKFLYDRAAGMPKIFADVARVSDNQTQLVARLIAYSKSKERFGPGDFTVNNLGQLVCPNGKIAAKAYRSQTADGLAYRFLAEDCCGCPLWDKCRGNEVKPDAYRQVFISDYTYFQRKALAYTKTAAFQEDMKLRPHVERIIAAVTRYNGARRAVAYGLDNADFQLKMCAMAYNLKRWHTLVKEKEKAQRYKPPDPTA